MDRSYFGSKKVKEAGIFKVVQISIKGDVLLYFGSASESTHSIILGIALEENLGMYDDDPPSEGAEYKVLGMGKVGFLPKFNQMIFSGISVGYEMDMRAADLTAIKAAYPDWEIVLSY